MVLFLIIIAFVIISTVFAIAAGVLSSRISRQEEWVETYETDETASVEAVPQSTE